MSITGSFPWAPSADCKKWGVFWGVSKRLSKISNKWQQTDRNAPITDYESPQPITPDDQ